MASINLSIPSSGMQNIVRQSSTPKQYSNLDTYNKRIASSDKSNFIKANADLINFIAQDSDLKAILQEKTINNRDDLKEVIVSGALEKLDKNSPVTRKFLEENFAFAKFVSANIGEIADVLNRDNELAETIVKDGNSIGGLLLNNITDKVVAALGATSPITKKFLNNRPEAAIHLLENPSDLSRVKNDRVEAKRFVDEIGQDSATYKAEIVAKAKTLLNMPNQFSTDFLEKDVKFAQQVVASELNDEGFKLAGYLSANADLTLNDFSTPGLIEAYQADLAESRLQKDFPLVRGFLLNNKAIAAAVVGSKELVANLKNEGPILESYFGPRSTSIDVNKEDYNTIAALYPSSYSVEKSQSLNIDFFI